VTRRGTTPSPHPHPHPFPLPHSTCKGAPALTDLSELRCLVLDEADRMVERGHYAELHSILRALPPFAPERSPPHPASLPPALPKK